MMTRSFFIRMARVCVLGLLVLPVLGGCLWAQEGELRDVPPKGITVAELIQRFAAKEKEFKVAREQYTWTQSVKVQTLEGSTVDGEYQQVFDVLFDDRGRRIEQVKFAPQNTLTRIEITQEDLDDIEKRMPFTMTIDDLPNYDVELPGTAAGGRAELLRLQSEPEEDRQGTAVFRRAHLGGRPRLPDCEDLRQERSRPLSSPRRARRTCFRALRRGASRSTESTGSLPTPRWMTTCTSPWATCTSGRW